MDKQFIVTVTSRDRLVENQVFRNETKARNFYADCLVRYPAYNVDLITSPAS